MEDIPRFKSMVSPTTSTKGMKLSRRLIWSRRAS
jgi:hypothetical protein